MIDNAHLARLLDHFRPDQKLKRIIKGIAQKPLQHWKAWGINYLSRKSAPVVDHTLCKLKMLPYVQYRPPLAQFWTFPMCPIIGYQGEELPLSFLSPSSGTCREQWVHHWATFYSNYTNPKSLTAPQKTFPPSFSSVLSSSSNCGAHFPLLEFFDIQFLCEDVWGLFKKLWANSCQLLFHKGLHWQQKRSCPSTNLTSTWASFKLTITTTC